jgi:uncharacterized protein YutE (UPF0331/DUF86 family)
MDKKAEIKQNWEKINTQLDEVKRFLDENKLDEALYFIWLVAENLVNTLKVSINGYYLKDHKAKYEVLKEYFVLRTLRKDYAETFKKLSKYRIVAEFHPYTSIPKDYTKKDVLSFLHDIQELKKEVEEYLIKKGAL